MSVGNPVVLAQGNITYGGGDTPSVAPSPESLLLLFVALWHDPDQPIAVSGMADGDGWSVVGGGLVTDAGRHAVLAAKTTDSPASGVITITPPGGLQCHYFLVEVPITGIWTVSSIIRQSRFENGFSETMGAALSAAPVGPTLSLNEWGGNNTGIVHENDQIGTTIELGADVAYMSLDYDSAGDQSHAVTRTGSVVWRSTIVEIRDPEAAANNDPSNDSAGPDTLIDTNGSGSYDHAADFSDPDSDPLTFSANPALPAGMSMTNAGLRSWSGMTAGALTLHDIIATDGNGGTDAVDRIVVGVAPDGTSWITDTVAAKTGIYAEAEFAGVAVNDVAYAYWETGSGVFDATNGAVQSDDGGVLKIWFHDVSDPDVATALNATPFTVNVPASIVTVDIGQIPLTIQAGWNKTDLVNPSIARGSVLDGYSATLPETGDDLEYRVTSTLDSGVTISVLPTGVYSVNEASPGDWANDIVIERRVVESSGDIGATESTTISAPTPTPTPTISANGSSMTRGDDYSVTVQNPPFAPTTSNATLISGNDTIACTNVVDQGSNTYQLTFPIGDLSKQADPTGYAWTLRLDRT